MDQHFQSHSMGVQDAKSVYSLIYLHDASISLSEWLRYARRRCSRPPERTGLIAIRDRRGVAHALFGYRIDIDLRARKRLCLNNLVVARMPGSQIDDAIIETANELASRFACHTISLERPFDQADEIDACPAAHGLQANRIALAQAGRRH